MPITRADLHGLILQRDSLDADGFFLLAHILKLLLGLDGQHSVVLVASKHTMPHYGIVFRKLGLNVAALAGAGRVVLLDALRPDKSHPQQLMNLRILHSAIIDSCAKVSASGAPVCVLFDDLTVRRHFCRNANFTIYFFCMSFLLKLHHFLSKNFQTLSYQASEPFEWPAFLHSSVMSAGSLYSCCVAVVHGDIAEDEKWSLQLEHRASTVLEIESLRTGRSAEVGGKLQITRRKLPPVAVEGKPEQLPASVELGVDKQYFGLAPDCSARFYKR
jgi:hypothetical protein